MALWLQFVREKRFETITHYFLISGHTHLPSDRDFALIEKAQKKHQQIYDHHEWINIIAKANKKFLVTQISQKDILIVSSLLQNVTKPKKTKCGEEVDFSSVLAFKFTMETPTSFFIKHAINGDFKEVQFFRVCRPADITLRSLKPKYGGPIKINKKKLLDVKSLLPFVPPVYHDFYNRLIPNEEIDAADDEVELV